MSTATDGEPYAEAQVLLRQIRERVADDVHDLIVERQEVGSQGEMVEQVRQVGRVAQRIVQARGRQMQAREMGLPLAAAVRDEREGMEVLRSTVMTLAGVCAAWVIEMDFEARRGEIES